MTIPTTGGRGSTRVAKKALVSTCTAVAAQELGVTTQDVKTSVFDSAGKLGLGITVDYPLPPLNKMNSHRHHAIALNGTVFDVLAQARARISQRLAYLCGSEMGAIDITLGGISSPEAHKARVK